MPATVADPNRSLDLEQISPATIAHHTVYEKTPNLHQSHICQWGAQPYLVGPLSRLVGKPPLSPWVLADVLPLTQVVNNTNSAIPLTEIFDRVFSDVCNSLGFEVQKQKKRGSGNNRVYRNLNRGEIPSYGGLLVIKMKTVGRPRISSKSVSTSDLSSKFNHGPPPFFFINSSHLFYFPRYTLCLLPPTDTRTRDSIYSACERGIITRAPG